MKKVRVSPFVHSFVRPSVCLFVTKTKTYQEVLWTGGIILSNRVATLVLSPLHKKGSSGSGVCAGLELLVKAGTLSLGSRLTTVVMFGTAFRDRPNDFLNAWIKASALKCKQVWLVYLSLFLS